jgi:large subunit ribosomal protein L6
MSRIGQQPIVVPPGVMVAIDGHEIRVSGPRGELARSLHPDITVSLQDNTITVTRPTDQPRHRALHGLTRTLVSNMVEGVSTGFTKALEMVGVGYRAQVTAQHLVLQVGFSHPVEFAPPEGIEFAVEGNTRIVVRGRDRQLVGQVAANIRDVRKPEPYKGKGIRYEGEYVRRKAGKAGVSG